MNYQEMIVLLSEVRSEITKQAKRTDNEMDIKELKRQADGLKETMDALDEVDRMCVSLSYVTALRK